MWERRMRDRDMEREEVRERKGERKKAMLFSINLSRAFSLKRSAGMSNILVIQSRRNILKGAWRGLVTRDVIRMVLKYGWRRRFSDTLHSTKLSLNFFKGSTKIWTIFKAVKGWPNLFAQMTHTRFLYPFSAYWVITSSDSPPWST